MPPMTAETTTALQPAPPQLAALFALLDENHGDTQRASLARALEVARDFASDALVFDPQRIISDYIVAEAEVGPCAKLHELIDKRPETPEHPFTQGDYLIVYSWPALWIGLALAYVILIENGTVPPASKGGAR